VRLRRSTQIRPTRQLKEVSMNKWNGWIAFAGWIMIIVGLLDFFEGLIAVIRKEYYALVGSQVIVFDVRTWGWITLFWGIAILLAGMALLSGAGWARWLTIVLVTANILGQLGFVGSAAYPLWALTVLTLNIIVLYALIVRWDDAAMGEPA
jgi:hypothetical protein